MRFVADTVTPLTLKECATSVLTVLISSPSTITSDDPAGLQATHVSKSSSQSVFTAITGTLRLDNVRLEGELRPVPLPGSFFLFATPLLGALLARLRGRCAQWLGAGHSRQPSSNGKYSPSMMGRASRLAMMRP